MRRELLLTLTLAAWACGGPPVPVAKAAPEPPPPIDVVPAPPAPSGGWNCTGNLVPPTGYLQETRFADRDLGAVTRAAEAGLRAKVCGMDCGPIDQAFTIWKTGEGAGRVCAMAVVKSAEVEAWRKRSLSVEALDEALARAAQQLRPQGLHVHVWRLEDGGVAGGDRVRWLLPRLQRALEKAGGVVVESAPAGWDGRGVPNGLGLVINGSLVARTERQIPILELDLQARVKEKAGVALRTADPVEFPAAVAPAGETPQPPAPKPDPGLGLRLDAAPAGGLCGGARTNLWLTVDAPLEVRVFDLYGADGALLLYAGRAKPGAPLALGGADGFDALPYPGSASERFLVLAAPDLAALGPWARATETCRVTAGVGAKLHAFQGLPAGVRLGYDGFRIETAPPCTPLDGGKREALIAQLAEVPQCP